MRAALIGIGVLVVVVVAVLAALLIYAETIQSGDEEVRIELEDTFPE